MNININIKLERPSMEEIEVNIIENDIIEKTTIINFMSTPKDNTQSSKYHSSLSFFWSTEE